MRSLIQHILKIISGEISKDDCEKKTQKHMHDKEKYLNLKHFESRKTIAKIKLSSQTLLILTGKRYKREVTQQIYIFCN